MLVANPIYDVVFKYLLDDAKVARLMLSALLGKEVLDLEFLPTHAHQPMTHPNGSEWLVLRMDFAVRVRREDGSPELALIEIQKAKSAWDVQAFQRCLGISTRSPGNPCVDPGGRPRALPNLTIYFLGEGLEGLDVPVLKNQHVSRIPAGGTEKVNRHYQDVATGEVVGVTDPLVKVLAQDSIVVQVNRLKGRRRTDLERLLAVFDQGRVSRSDPRLLDILEENVPERYRDVLHRLLRAGAEQGTRDGMDVEDDVVAAFRFQARKTAQALEEKDRIIGAKDKAIEAKDKAIEEKDRLIADLERRLGRA